MGFHTIAHPAVEIRELIGAPVFPRLVLRIVRRIHPVEALVQLAGVGVITAFNGHGRHPVGEFDAVDIVVADHFHHQLEHEILHVFVDAVHPIESVFLADVAVQMSRGPIWVGLQDEAAAGRTCESGIVRREAILEPRIHFHAMTMRFADEDGERIASRQGRMRMDRLPEAGGHHRAGIDRVSAVLHHRKHGIEAGRREVRHGFGDGLIRKQDLGIDVGELHAAEFF